MNFSSSGQILLFLARSCWPLLLDSLYEPKLGFFHINKNGSLMDVSNYENAATMCACAKSQWSRCLICVRDISYFPHERSDTIALSVLSGKAPRQSGCAFAYPLRPWEHSPFSFLNLLLKWSHAEFPGVFLESWLTDCGGDARVWTFRVTASCISEEETF